MQVQRALTVVALFLLVSTLDARSKSKRSTKGAKRRKNTDATGGVNGADSHTLYEYDASDCHGPWDVGSGDEAQLILANDRCDFEEINAVDLTEEIFAERFALRRPLIVRHTRANEEAREFLLHRCDVLRRYGTVPVDLGDPFSLAKHGRSTRRMSLGDYLDAPFDTDMPLYFFDRNGHWSKSMGELSKLVSVPSSISLKPQSKPGEVEPPIIFAVGKDGSGIGLHQHQDAWNQVLFGRKRWTVYAGEQALQLAASFIRQNQYAFAPDLSQVTIL